MYINTNILYIRNVCANTHTHTHTRTHTHTHTHTHVHNTKTHKHKHTHIHMYSMYVHTPHPYRHTPLIMDGICTYYVQVQEYGTHSYEWVSAHSETHMEHSQAHAWLKEDFITSFSTKKDTEPTTSSAMISNVLGSSIGCRKHIISSTQIPNHHSLGHNPNTT